MSAKKNGQEQNVDIQQIPVGTDGEAAEKTMVNIGTMNRQVYDPRQD